MSRKLEVEQERVRGIALQYHLISEMLGLRQSKFSKVPILKAAMKFITENSEGVK